MPASALHRARSACASVLALLLLAAVQLAAVDAEVDLQRSGVSKADGATDSTGSSAVALTNYDITYDILNAGGTGAANLTLGPVVTSGASNCTASVLTQPASTIAGGASSPCVIRVTPAAVGAWQVAMTFTTSDADEATYNLLITGTATTSTADMTVRYGGTVLADGTGVDSVTGTNKGVAFTRTYTIANATTAAPLTVSPPVVIQSASNCTASITAQPATRVVGGTTTSFTASVTPGQGAWSCVVRIDNSDPDNGLYSFTISGSAAGPEIAVSRGTTQIPSGSVDTPPIVSIASEQSSLGYTIANTGTGTLNIVRYPDDRSPGQIQFSAVRHWAAEGGSVDIVIKRLFGHRGAVTVDWYTDSDSALAELDFPIQSGTVSWADGDTADKVIAVATATDTLVEGTEQFVVHLHNAQGGASIITPFDAYVAVEDDDAANGSPPNGLITYTASTRKYYFAEQDATRSIAVQRTGAIDVSADVHCRIDLIDGSGTLGADYEVIPATAGAAFGVFYADATAVDAAFRRVWAADNDDDDFIDTEVYSNGTYYLVYWMGGVNGQALVPVKVLGDATIEPNESFHLRLSNNFAAGDDFPGTNLGTATSSDHNYQDATVFVTDDDASAQTLSIITEELNCSATVLAAPDRSVLGSGTTNLPIRVVPTAAGYWQFRVTIENDDTDEGGYTWLVTGTAAADVPDIAIAHNGVAIPDGTTDTITGTIAGSDSPLTFTISNTGTADLGLTVPPAFSAQSNCVVTYTGIGTTTVLSGSSTQLFITVRPTSPGAWSAMMSLTNSDPDENTYDILLSGIATAAPAPEFQWYRAGATQTAIATGGTDLRSDLTCIQGLTYTIEYRVGNLGSAALTLDTGTDSVTASSGVAATPTFTTPAASVASGGQTAISFTFTPNAATWSFTYSLANNDADENPATITISGSASAPAPDAAIYRSASLIPNGSDDAPTGIYATVPTILTYGISNEGSQTLNLTTPTAISAQVNCTAAVTTEVAGAIAAGASSQLQISVTPTAPGPYSFTVAIDSDDADEDPVTWNVVAIAEEAPVSRPEIQVQRSGTNIADNSVDVIGALLVGSPQQLSYAINNTGSLLLTLGTPAITAQSGCAVRIVSPPSANVAAAAGTTLLVEVTPTVGGAAWSFTWSVATNDSDENPTDVTVAGTGIASATPEIAVDRNGTAIADDDADAFGAIYTDTNTAITYTVTNVGGAILTLSPAATIDTTSNCAVTILSGLAPTIAAGGSSDLILNVVASASPWSFWINIPNNDATPGANPYRIQVTGTASVAPADITVESGGVVVADASTTTVSPTTTTFTYTVTNTGYGVLGINDITFTRTGALTADPVPAWTAAGLPATTPFTLGAGASATLVLTVTTPAPVAAWSFTAHIDNDDPDVAEQDYSFVVDAPYVPLISVARSGVDKVSDINATVDLSGTTDTAADTVSGTSVGVATTLTYVVTNSGADTLTISGATLLTSANCTVTVTDGLTGTLAAASSDNLIFTVTPTSGAIGTGWWFAYRITSDADDDPVFNLTVASPTVALLAPEIQVYAGTGTGTAITTAHTTSISTMASTSTTLAYTVGNLGLGSLTLGTPVVTAGVNCTAVLVDNLDPTVVGGSTSGMAVLVTPTTAGTWTFTISVANNDGDENPAVWTVTGTAMPLSVTPGDLGLGGSSGGCGAGSSMGLIAGFAALAFLVRGGRRGRRDAGEAKE